MSTTNFIKGPNIVHPEKPSAVGSRNSLNRDGRNEYQESQYLVDEEVDKIINHIHSKLPPEALSRLDVSGNIKEVLHNYINQSFQNMYNRYLTTVEDEMAKKFRDLVDSEEAVTQKQYTPRGIGDLLVDVGGEDKFNSAEIEKGIVNVYSHLQGHLQKSIGVLESDTNSILRQKADIGATVRGENAYSIVKCTISDSNARPNTVSDVVLSINILDEELHSKIFHYQEMTERIIKDVIGQGIMDMIDKNVEKLNERLIDKGEQEIGSNEKIFERISSSEQYLSEETTTNPEGKEVGKYALVDKIILDSIKGLSAESAAEDFDPLSLKEQAQHTINRENIRNRGFNTAVNSLSSILDAARLPYQHIENFKNKRMIIVKENRCLDRKELPDENFEIELSYHDQRQLVEERIAYQQQMLEFQGEVEQLERITEKMYHRYFRQEGGKIDFSDLAKVYSPDTALEDNSDVDIKYNSGIWVDVHPDDAISTDVEDNNPTYVSEHRVMVQRLRRLKSKIKASFRSNYPNERNVLEGRIQHLIVSLEEFYKGYNPYQVQSGLLMLIRLTTIKRKQTTLRAIGDVINEFLYKLSKGFSDTAFANFNRRRSIDEKINEEVLA